MDKGKQQQQQKTPNHPAQKAPGQQQKPTTQNPKQNPGSKKPGSNW